MLLSRRFRAAKHVNITSIGANKEASLSCGKSSGATTDLPLPQDIPIDYAMGYDLVCAASKENVSGENQGMWAIAGYRPIHGSAGSINGRERSLRQDISRIARDDKAAGVRMCGYAISAAQVVFGKLVPRTVNLCVAAHKARIRGQQGIAATLTPFAKSTRHRAVRSIEDVRAQPALEQVELCGRGQDSAKLRASKRGQRVRAGARGWPRSAPDGADRGPKPR